MVRTPLHIAAKKGRKEVCKLILEHIEDKNPKDITGDTPFHIAAKKGYFEICELIIQNIQDKNMETFLLTLLDCGSGMGKTDVCELIQRYVKRKNGHWKQLINEICIKIGCQCCKKRKQSDSKDTPEKKRHNFEKLVNFYQNKNNIFYKNMLIDIFFYQNP